MDNDYSLQGFFDAAVVLFKSQVQLSKPQGLWLVQGFGPHVKLVLVTDSWIKTELVV